MSLNTYLEVTDITHVHLKQFPDEILQPYVDEANDMLEDLASQKGIPADNIGFNTTDANVPLIVKRYLNSYIVYRFAEDSIGTNNVEVSDDDMYKKMMKDFSPIVDGYKNQLTPEVLRGVASASRKARSVSSGRMFRTA